MPLIHENGQYLMPGRKYKMIYGKKTHYRAGAPYTPCNDTVPTMLQVVYDRVAHAAYGYHEYSCFVVGTQTYM